jgi:hypothetical protein
METRFLIIAATAILFQILIYSVFTAVFMFSNSAISRATYYVTIFVSRVFSVILCQGSLFARNMKAIPWRELLQSCKTLCSGRRRFFFSKSEMSKPLTDNLDVYGQQVAAKLAHGLDLDQVYAEELDRIVVTLQELMMRRSKKILQLEDSVMAIDILSSRMRDCLTIIEILENHARKAGVRIDFDELDVRGAQKVELTILGDKNNNKEEAPN